MQLSFKRVLLSDLPFILAQIADFGMSLSLNNGSKSHISGIRHGTPLYIAPEIVKENKLSKAADVYSYGVILWELYHATIAWEVSPWGGLDHIENTLRMRRWSGIIHSLFYPVIPLGFMSRAEPRPPVLPSCHFPLLSHTPLSFIPLSPLPPCCST